MAPQIFFHELDSRFKDEIGEKTALADIKPCFTCGSCTGICPVHRIIEDFDPRRIIYMIMLGMRKKVLSSDLIWFCCLCNECFTVCPQRIKFSHVILKLRKMAMEGGYADEGFLKKIEKINPYLQDLCRRIMFYRLRDGFHGPHTMPCWRKHSTESP